MRKELGGLIAQTYVGIRRKVRAIVTANSTLDRLVARRLVKIDVLLRRTGVLDPLLETGIYNFNGLKLHSNPNRNELIASLVTNGSYEPETLEAIISTLQPGSNFVDLGAHIGFFALHAAQIIGESGRVFAFEPTPETRKTLTRNVRENNFDSRVVIAPYAISDKRQTVFFELQKQSQGNTVVADKSELPDGAVIEVEAISLDEYFAQQGWPDIDLIKMDIEGQELNAFKGMSELLKRNPNLKIIFEYQRTQMARADVSKEQLFEKLVEMGFNRFNVLFRQGETFQIPLDFARLNSLAARASFNILAESL